MHLAPTGALYRRYLQLGFDHQTVEVISLSSGKLNSTQLRTAPASSSCAELQFRGLQTYQHRLQSGRGRLERMGMIEPQDF